MAVCLEDDVAVAAAVVPAVVAMGTAAAACLDEGGDGKQTPGPRRLKQDEAKDRDDIPALIQEDVANGCLHVLCDDVLLTLSTMTMQKEDFSRDALGDHEDRDVEDIVPMMPSKMMKELMRRCGGVVCR